MLKLDKLAVQSKIWPAEWNIRGLAIGHKSRTKDGSIKLRITEMMEESKTLSDYMQSVRQTPPFDHDGTRYEIYAVLVPPFQVFILPDTQADAGQAWTPDKSSWSDLEKGCGLKVYPHTTVGELKTKIRYKDKKISFYKENQISLRPAFLPEAAKQSVTDDQTLEDIKTYDQNTFYLSLTGSPTGLRKFKLVDRPHLEKSAETPIGCKRLFT